MPDALTVPGPTLPRKAQTSLAPAAALPRLDAERLDVYAVAVEFQLLAAGLLPRRQAILRNQLERASVSVVLNIAEATVSHYPLEETGYEKRRSCAPQVADATSIRRPGRLPLVTWT